MDNNWGTPQLQHCGPIMQRTGFEPAHLSITDLKSVPFTTRAPMHSTILGIEPRTSDGQSDVLPLYYIIMKKR